MIVVTVHLWPHGDPSHARHVATAVIANDGHGSATTADYTAWLGREGITDVRRIMRGQHACWRKTRIHGFARRGGPWTLIHRCLDELVGERTLTTHGEP